MNCGEGEKYFIGMAMCSVRLAVAEPTSAIILIAEMQQTHNKTFSRTLTGYRRVSSIRELPGHETR